MRFTQLAVLIQAIGAALAGSNCDNANNCQRALLKTVAGKQNPLSDCNSYLRATVTPSTVTVTVTGTSIDTATDTEVDVITSTQTISVVLQTQIVVVPPPKKRAELGRNQLEVRQMTVRPSSIPAYASPCSEAAKYSSACSCIGATTTTVTVAAPTTSTTVSTTLSTTVTTTTVTVAVVTETTTVGPPPPPPPPSCQPYQEGSCANTIQDTYCLCHELADGSNTVCVRSYNGFFCTKYPSCNTQEDCMTPGDLCVATNLQSCPKICQPLCFPGQ